MRPLSAFTCPLTFGGGCSHPCWPLTLQGTEQGWFLDPQTFEFLTSSPAMRQALDMFAQLKNYTWPDGTCVLWPPRMLSGECAMTVKWNEVRAVT